MRLAIASGTPFVGFGIADNGIMILAGAYRANAAAQHHRDADRGCPKIR